MQKTVLITGANRGIGLGLCHYYLEQGCKVIAACRNPQNMPLLGQHTDMLEAIALDVSSPSSIEGFAKSITRRSASLDLIINNAGVSVLQSFGEWTPEAFMTSFSVNAMGPALLIQALHKYLNPEAKVIQISSGLAAISTAGMQADSFCSYAMTKAALNMLSVKLSAILQDRNITVAAINPGWIQTDMGGPHADDTIKEAVPKIASTIAGLSPINSGSFVDTNNKTIPW